VESKEIKVSEANALIMAKVGYILFFTPFSFVTLVIAYVYRNDVPEWVKSHFQFQIYTFWTALAYAALFAILAPFTAGASIVLGVLFLFVFCSVRPIRGIKFLDEKRPYPNPTSSRPIG
jgi:uncharacterized membrane protein